MEFETINQLKKEQEELRKVRTKNNEFKNASLIGDRQVKIDLLEKVKEVGDELTLKKIKDFGISMAGKYRNQGMLEFKKELKSIIQGEPSNENE